MCVLRHRRSWKIIRAATVQVTASPFVPIITNLFLYKSFMKYDRVRAALQRRNVGIGIQETARVHHTVHRITAELLFCVCARNSEL